MLQKFKHRWRRRQIDSRLAKMTNKSLIEEWASDYGEDSDFFKVRVRGLFPSSSEIQFIPQHYADAAMNRQLGAQPVFICSENNRR